MRAALALILALLFSPLPAAAQEAEIQETIDNQLKAFMDRDAALAFSYASPTIKGLFGTPSNFAMMVQEGYPMVWTPKDCEMLELREVAGNLWQRVRITDTEGKDWLLDYQMIETPDGWRINAVQILPGGDPAV